MDCAKKEVKYLKDEDCYFIENVMIDIRAYLNVLNDSANKNKVLLLPPVNNYRRFLVHKLVEETFCNNNLATLSVGKLYGRRTVIYPSKLIHMEKNDNTSALKTTISVVNEDPKKKSIPIYRPPAVRKRENVAKNSIMKNQDRKSRKPDQQIYIPRAKRLNCSQSDDCAVVESIQDENKLDYEIKTKSNDECVEIDCKRDPCRDEGEFDNSQDVEFIGIVEQDIKVNDKIQTPDSAPSLLNTENDINDIDLSSNHNKSTVADRPEIGSSVSDENVPVAQSANEISIDQQMSSSKEEIDIISLDDSSCQSVDDVNKLSFNDTLEQMAASAATLKSEPESDSKKTDKVRKSTSQTKSLDVDNCDWEELFDESGEYVDHSLIDELMTAIGKVSVQRAAQDYRSFQTEEERSSDGECIIEVHGFPSEFKTEDLFDVFTAYRSDRGFQIVWVDDTHALAIFSSPLIADEVLNTQLPFVKTRPLKNAIAKSKMKASNFALPPATRPKTCVSLARRLVSGHLGMKIDVTPKQREAERKLLSDAREQKRLMAKQKLDAWEGSSSGGKS